MSDDANLSVVTDQHAMMFGFIINLFARIETLGPLFTIVSTSVTSTRLVRALPIIRKVDQ